MDHPDRAAESLARSRRDLPQAGHRARPADVAPAPTTSRSDLRRREPCGDMMNAISPPEAYRGPAFLSYGFRPFFLLGAIYAGIAVLAWLPMFYGELELSTAFAPIDWHVHEMLYGYLPAVMTGFLLTAIPNWTGRLPIRGMPLLTLVAVWLAGRVAVTFSAESDWVVGAAI